MAIIHEYIKLDATELAHWIRHKKISAEEALNCALTLCHRLNPKLRAIVNLWEEEAKANASKLPMDQAFSGVPFLIKDLICNYAGKPTTGSSRFSKNYIPTVDSELVAKHKALGLNIFGKTNTPELGIFGVTESELNGKCANPWNLSYTPGGSSGGSASAVSSRIVPMAHGGDGGGSIRIPASACGIVGLKTTRLRIPSDQDLKASNWQGTVVENVLTRSIRDTAAMLELTRSKNPDIKLPVPPGGFVEGLKTRPKNLRVAYSTQSLFGNKTDPECADALLKAMKVIAQLGYEVIEKNLNLPKDELVLSYLLGTASSVVADIDGLSLLVRKEPRPEEFELVTWFLYLIGKSITADQLERAKAARRVTERAVAEIFENCDLYATPTLAYPPSKLGLMELPLPKKIATQVLCKLNSKHLFQIALKQFASEGVEKTPNTQLFNMAGNPAISLPLYWGKDNLPIGIQFAAAYGREDLLLAIGQELEEEYRWGEKIPDLSLRELGL